MRHCLEKTDNKKGLGEWLKCRPGVKTPVLKIKSKKQKKKNKKQKKKKQKKPPKKPKKTKPTKPPD
jgi:hypothetical protein